MDKASVSGNDGASGPWKRDNNICLFLFYSRIIFQSLLSLLDLGRAPEVFLLSVRMHFYDNYNNGNRLPLFYKVGVDSWAEPWMSCHLASLLSSVRRQPVTVPWFPEAAVQPSANSFLCLRWQSPFPVFDLITFTIRGSSLTVSFLRLSLSRGPSECGTDRWLLSS